MSASREPTPQGEAARQTEERLQTLEALRQERDRLAQVAEGRRAEIVALQGELRRLGQRVEGSAGEAARLEFDLGRAQADYRALVEQHDQLSVLHEQLLAQRAALMQELAGLQAQVDQWMEACSLQAQRRTQAEAETKELSDALLKAAGHAQRLRAQVAALEAQAAHDRHGPGAPPDRPTGRC